MPLLSGRRHYRTLHASRLWPLSLGCGIYSVLCRPQACPASMAPSIKHHTSLRPLRRGDCRDVTRATSIALRAGSYRWKENAGGATNHAGLGLNGATAGMGGGGRLATRSCEQPCRFVRRAISRTRARHHIAAQRRLYLRGHYKPRVSNIRQTTSIIVPACRGICLLSSCGDKTFI